MPKIESAKSYGAFGRGTSIGFKSGAITGTESNAYYVPNGESQSSIKFSTQHNFFKNTNSMLKIESTKKPLSRPQTSKPYFKEVLGTQTPAEAILDHDNYIAISYKSFKGR